MKLISCDNCGVILDADKLNFADDLRGEDDCILDNIAIWHDGEFVAYVHCPVCKSEVIQS